MTEACVEAAGLPDNCKELVSLRSFRDEHLAKSEEGRKIISEYYEVAPKIVEATRRKEDSNKIFHAIFSEIRKIVSLLEMGNMRGDIEYYKDMVLRLKKKYIENL
ncbi:CFI-box-CTERM domain-containing protein [Caldisericum sp.]|uniref:CFI-box-CTERM domain-containing protein n=1 Tax=Caldisericum sp. TaxID=2499687 RepID=UPI003D0B93FF